MAVEAPEIAPRSDQSDLLTERLLHSAAEVFAEQGYERAGVAEIARRAGVTTGAIYSRYSGKAELLLDAANHHVSDEIQHLLRTEIQNEPATQVLASLGAHLLDELPAGAGLFLEAIVAGRRDPELAAAIRGRVEAEDERLAELMRKATSDGLLDPELDELATVRLAHAIGFGMALTRSIGLDLPDADAWTTIINRVISAVGMPQNPPDSKPGDEL